MLLPLISPETYNPSSEAKDSTFLLWFSIIKEQSPAFNEMELPLFDILKYN